MSIRNIGRSKPIGVVETALAPVATSGATAEPASEGEERPGPKPTLESAASARERWASDPTALQLRARIDASFGGGDDASEGTAVSRRRFSLETPLETWEGFVPNGDGSYTFRGGSGDDAYTVLNAADGNITVRNENTGETYELPAGQAPGGLIVDGGDGNDTIVVVNGLGSPYQVWAVGGAGDDRLSAAGDVGAYLEGGEGNDQLIGSNAADRLVGGDGADALEGGDGDDEIVAGAGDDQLLGQQGDDHLDGGDGNDFVQGALGADRIEGGAGGDALYGDAFDDIAAGPVADDGAVDVIVTEDGAPAPAGLGANDIWRTYDPAEVDAYLRDHPELVIRGRDDHVLATRANIGVMLRTQSGRALLDELTGAVAADGETIAFLERGAPNGRYFSDGNRVEVGLWAQGDANGDGASNVPLTLTYHELVHAYQDNVAGYPQGSTVFADGSVIRNRERQASGLPWADEHGQLHAGDELPHNENAFRSELGLPLRGKYENESGEILGWTPEEKAPD